MKLFSLPEIFSTFFMTIVGAIPMIMSVFFNTAAPPFVYSTMANIKSGCAVLFKAICSGAIFSASEALPIAVFTFYASAVKIIGLLVIIFRAFLLNQSIHQIQLDSKAIDNILKDIYVFLFVDDDDNKKQQQRTLKLQQQHRRDPNKESTHRRRNRQRSCQTSQSQQRNVADMTVFEFLFRSGMFVVASVVGAFLLPFFLGMKNDEPVSIKKKTTEFAPEQEEDGNSTNFDQIKLDTSWKDSDDGTVSTISNSSASETSLLQNSAAEAMHVTTCLNSAPSSVAVAVDDRSLSTLSGASYEKQPAPILKDGVEDECGSNCFGLIRFFYAPPQQAFVVHLADNWVTH